MIQLRGLILVAVVCVFCWRDWAQELLTPAALPVLLLKMLECLEEKITDVVKMLVVLTKSPWL